MNVSSVGEQLRAAREAQGLQLEDVASRTRIPTRHLQMIERGEYTGLPAPTYSAGFIKTYARLLGLDGQRLSQDFRQEIGTSTVESANIHPYEPADPRRTPPAGIAVLAMLVALIAGLGYLYWRGSSENPTEIAATAGDTPAAPARTAAAPPQGAVPAPQAGGPVSIAAREDVWIKVADGGKTLFMGVLKPGSSFAVPAEATEPVLTTGRPGSTLITVGQTTIPPVGDPGRAAKDVSLKPAALLARLSTTGPSQPAPGAPTPVATEANPA